MMTDLQLLTLAIIDGRITVEAARIMVIAKARAEREAHAEAMKEYRRARKAAA